MNSNKNLHIIFILFGILFQVKNQAQVTIDDSAISIFWELVDTLSTDKDPSEMLWKKFASHPAYVQIERSGNRVKFLKKVMPLVFKPSKSEKLERVLKGDETITQYFAAHLNEVKLQRHELNSYLKSNQIESYKNSYIKALEYLPGDLNRDEINLTVYIALFEDNGFGGKVITMDLLHLMNGTDEDNMDFFGHEFHHALRLKTEMYTLFESSDITYIPVVTALNKLPLEGVASMIDKAKYFDDFYLAKADSMSESQQESIVEFQELIAQANVNLAKIDSTLASDLNPEEKGDQIFANMPWSGHSVGYFMARAIENGMGRDKLIKVQYSCIDFLFAYQKVAKNDDSLYTFSVQSIDYLERIK